MPLVSVIITTHNRSHLLQRAINSVLGQCFRDFELIIVDDASVDSTPRMLGALPAAERMKIFRIEESKGANHARNAGLGLAQGEYVAFLDDDDFWYPEKLSRQVRALSQDHTVSMVGCWFLKGTHVYKLPSELPYRALFYGNIIGGFSMAMLRTRDIRASGGLDECLQNSQDWDLWLRIGRLGKIVIVPECLAVYGLTSADQITKRSEQAVYYANYMKVVNRYEKEMGFWTRLKHRLKAAFHTTSRARWCVRRVRWCHYLIARVIDRALLTVMLQRCGGKCKDYGGPRLRFG